MLQLPLSVSLSLQGSFQQDGSHLDRCSVTSTPCDKGSACLQCAADDLIWGPDRAWTALPSGE
jgi:hypothetical protein